jgi:DNA-binding transcriptional MerR regulator
MSEIFYSTGEVAARFEVSLETVRTWSKEFARHLSPKATPKPNRHRAFTRDDLTVFALVSELRSQGMRFEDIHANLSAGQRGTLPDELPIIPEQLATQDDFKALIRTLNMLDNQLEVAQAELEELRPYRDKAIRLEASLESAKAERERLEARIEELTKAIQELSLKAGQQYASGYVDGFRADSHPDENRPSD